VVVVGQGSRRQAQHGRYVGDLGVTLATRKRRLVGKVVGRGHDAEQAQGRGEELVARLGDLAAGEQLERAHAEAENGLAKVLERDGVRGRLVH